MFEAFGTVSFISHTKIAGFVERLRDGQICASRCLDCHAQQFPPRADCPQCRSPRYEFVPIDAHGTLHTFTRISAAPTGFGELAPYALGLVDLADGGRAVAPLGPDLPIERAVVGMPVRLVPHTMGDATEKDAGAAAGEAISADSAAAESLIRVTYTIDPIEGVFS